MIVDERMVTFINSLDEGHTEFLEQLEKEAREDAVPIVRREMQSFLKFLMAAARPKRILEVGTAVGFSALLMCEYNPEPCQIMKRGSRLPGKTLRKRARRDRSNFWREMRQRSCRHLPSRLTLSLWMRRRDSTFTFCRKFCAC